MIRIKRVYDEPDPNDGKRYLIDRLWPRGFKKESLLMDDWKKEIAPSTELRKWFSHDPAKFEEFKVRYREELLHNEDVWLPVLHEAQEGTVTLLLASRNLTHNHAIVFKEFLEEKIGQ